MAIVNENYTNQFEDSGGLPFNSRSPFVSNNQASNTDSNLVKDYEGKTYDPAVIWHCQNKLLVLLILKQLKAVFLLLKVKV